MPAEFEGEFARAAAFIKAGNHVDAIGVYAEIVSHDNATTAEKVRAYSNMSACHASKDQFSAALSAAKEALRLDEQSSKAHGRAATAYHGLRHYEEAARHYEQAKALDPSNALYAEQHRVVLELIRGGKGIATQETRDAYHYRRAMEHAKEAMGKGEYLSAIRHFGRAIELHKESGEGAEGLAVLLCNRSAAYSRASRHLESLSDAMRSAEVRPTYARAFFRIAYAQNQLKRPLEAQAALKRCLEIDPSHAEAAALMADVGAVLAEQRKSAEERQRERVAEVQAERESLAAERMQSDGAFVSAHRGPAHATSYVHCGYCNEAGHSRAECPLLRRKRSRTQ